MWGLLTNQNIFLKKERGKLKTTYNPDYGEETNQEWWMLSDQVFRCLTQQTHQKYSSISLLYQLKEILNNQTVGFCSASSMRILSKSWELQERTGELWSFIVNPDGPPGGSDGSSSADGRTEGAASRGKAGLDSCIDMYTYIAICMYVCRYVCMNVCMCLFIYIYIYIYIYI